MDDMQFSRYSCDIREILENTEKIEENEKGE